MSNWTPRAQPGGVYCSPACGAQCTKAAYIQAMRESKALGQRMDQGWVARVWENLGWHYSVIKGVVNIHPSRSGGYTVYFNTELQVVTTGTTPEAALRLAILQSRDNAARILADCDAL